MRLYTSNERIVKKSTDFMKNKQNVGNFLLPLVATRQVRQGGYLHENIFDVQHLHQSKGRKYFVRY